jgi:hypothetical protein
MKWQLFGEREPGVAEGLDGDSADRLPASDAAFWASPVGQAARAMLRGDRFFQIELDDTTLAAYAETAAPADTGRRARRTRDLLGQIEELGWHLEHVSWWRVDAGEPAADQHPRHSGPRADHVRGVYLFHSVPSLDPDETVTPAAAGDGPAPTHRRELS